MGNGEISSDGACVCMSMCSSHEFPLQQMHLNGIAPASEELMLAVIVSRADYILRMPCLAILYINEQRDFGITNSVGKCSSHRIKMHLTTNFNQNECFHSIKCNNKHVILRRIEIIKSKNNSKPGIAAS